MDHREQELKFDVPEGWQLPDPARLLPPGGSVDRQDVRLESTYFDTDDRSLLRNRVTLRRRTGDTDTGWQLKVPDGDARLEIVRPLADGGRGVPEPLRNATQGARAGAALKPIATVRTSREISRLFAADGTALAEIALDTVTTGDGVRTQHWREVEVELVDGDEQLLQRAARWLIRRGATPAGRTSKLARAVGAEPDETRDPATLAGLIAGYLDRQHEAILRGDVDLRRGIDPPAAVHATRVATRRYRSVLRVFAPVLTEDVAELDVELRWFAAALGAVRDLHVLRRRLDQELADLPPELVLGPVAARIQEELGRRHAEADEELRRVMRSRRYYALLCELQRRRAEPPVVADGPAKDAAQYLHRAERTVARRAREAADPQARHRVRKAAKRARYAAELSRPALGKAAGKSAKGSKAIQRELGDRQDARIAAEFLYRLGTAAGASGENGFSYGLLYERQRARAEAP